MVLPISKVVLVGAGDREVQSAELIRVIVPSCWETPLQNTEVVPPEWLSF